MPYTTRADGDVLTASSHNANCRDQVISTVTSGTRPGGTEGQMIGETDTDLFQVYSGSGWVTFGGWGSHLSFVPVVGGGWAIGNGTVTGNYIRIGRVVSANFAIQWGTTSTFGAGGLTVALPISSARIFNCPIEMQDTGTATRSGVGQTTAASTNMSLYSDAGGTWANVTSTVPHTWAATDVIRCNIVYEAS